MQKGTHNTAETRRKMSLSRKHYLLTHSGPMKGHTQTKEARHKISIANLGRPCSKETRYRISAAQIGRQFSKETRSKLSARWTPERKRKQTQQLLETMSNHNPRHILKGFMSSDEKYVAHQLQLHHIKFRTQETLFYRHADFYIPELDLYVECDGNYWHECIEGAKKKDQRFNEFARSKGKSILRIAGNTINSHRFDIVQILEKLLRRKRPFIIEV